jgi:hypothetical protein
MISKKEANAIAEAFLRNLAGSDELRIIPEETLERSFGWVFFYNSKAYLESGDESFLIAGNAPIIVDRRSMSM